MFFVNYNALFLSLFFRRASSVNLSSEKLSEAVEDPVLTRPLDSAADGQQRQTSTEREPPPKPPHTYYNLHRFSEGGEGRLTGICH